MLISNKSFVTSDLGIVAALSVNGIQSESFGFDDKGICEFHYTASDTVRDIVTRYRSGALMVVASLFQATVRDTAKWVRAQQRQKARQ